MRLSIVALATLLLLAAACGKSNKRSNPTLVAATPLVTPIAATPVRTATSPAATPTPSEVSRGTASATAGAAGTPPLPPPPPPPPPPPSTSGARSQEGIKSAQPVGNLCPLGYPIKGDTNARYYRSTDPEYESVTPVVCFASTEDATTAGYKPAHAG